MAETIKIGGELESTATGNKVTDASAVKDKAKGNKSQAEFNSDVVRHENEINGSNGLDSRLRTVEELAEISVGGGDIGIGTAADFESADPSDLAKVPTVGAILGGLNDGIYDVSKRNPTAGPNSDGKFTLDYILDNANTLIPTGWRHGGMTISFVHTSDNKYVQFRCKTQSFSFNPIDWNFCSDDTIVENAEFAYVKLDATGKILWAIKIDGSIYWGAGVPQQVIDYVTTKIQELPLDEYEDIVTFLGDLINGDKTLQQLLAGKVDKVTGKSLVNEDVANSMSFNNSDEYIQVLIDGEGKIIETITSEGDKKIFVPIDTPAGKITYSESNEFYKTLLDSNRKIVFGIKRNGLVYSPLNIIKANKYIGRTLTFLGDSLSGGLVAGEYAIWAKGCKEVLGLNVEGTQIGGTSICGTAETCYWQDSRINALSPNASIVVIEGGTNDIGSVMGDKTPENYDTTTFWGGFNVMLSKIYYKYLNVVNGYYTSIDYSNVNKVSNPLYKLPIFVILPPQITLNEGDEHYPEWVNNIKIIRENLIELCELWGLDYIDANKIGYNRMTHTQGDAVHGAMNFFDVLSEKVVSKLIEYNV